MKLTVAEATELVKAHQREIRRYLLALGCTRAEAEDFTQETFLSLFRSDFEIRGPGQTRSYLRRTARHLLIDSRRKARPTVDIESVDCAWEHEIGEDGGDERVRLLRECLGRLRGRAREAVMLKYGRGLSHEECGARLGAGEEATKSLIRRAREKLRECMEAGLSDE